MTFIDTTEVARTIVNLGMDEELVALSRAYLALEAALPRAVGDLLEAEGKPRTGFGADMAVSMYIDLGKEETQ